ncbi:endonuclease domain-containing protein [Nonomuraea dietziae]|uniref:endonuclease domain-containing protein n=1 Tax=Nonomuraea dietziae TaxID=65515 RepID=UPI0033F3A624
MKIGDTVCGICCGSALAFCWDHDPEDGYLRGILCEPCSEAVALINRDPSRAARMAEWLR